MEASAAKPALQKSGNPPTPSTPERHLQHTRLASSEKKAVGYGLPCSRCHAYYPADMDICPICKSLERVSPTARVAHSGASVTPGLASSAQVAGSQVSGSQITGSQIGGSQIAGSQISGLQIDDERERFLRELKSQAFASHTQINAAATFRCVLAHQHNGSTEPAAVCHSCYSEARQEADRLEAALHMDAKEAAKIVYEAVWADTSDPGTTYLNAATALLSELRKRAGIGLLLGNHQPLAH